MIIPFYQFDSGTAGLTFSSFGDTNGLFYYLGTNNLTTSWSNPCPSKVTITNSGGVGTTSAELYTDRDTSSLAPSGNAFLNPAFETFQLLTGVNFILKQYVLQFIPGSGNDKPLQWFMAGSNNGSSWTTLQTQSTDYDWVTNSYNYLSPLISNKTVYSYYKIHMVNENSGGAWSMRFAETEFYGEFS